jgi:hypothetical protein
MAGIPAVVSWRLVGSQSGLGRYELQVQRDGRPFAAIALSSYRATSRIVTLQAGHTYRYRVRAVDSTGHAGAWKSVGPRVGLAIPDASASMTWTGAWSPIALQAYLGGQGHSTNAKGATATLRFSGTSVAWVGPVGPTRGKAQVYIDGRLMTTVDLWAPSFHARRIVFAASVRDGAHTLVIKALGTASRPTVNVDAIYVLRAD